MTTAVAQKSPVDKLKSIVSSESVQEQFKNALQEGAPLFVASLIDIYANDKNLQKCPANLVVMEALKAATLKLPINKQLGFAYIVPYSDTPQFQLGYKGYIQLAMRTGQYKYINADLVYEGELKRVDKLTGEVDLSGSRASETVVGYFAYIETTNGFRKPLYWSKEKVEAHAKKYSKSYHMNNSAWKTDFDAMALKTMIRNLLSKYGIMSVEMMSAITSDNDEKSYDERVQEEVDAHANAEVIDIQAEDAPAGPSF